MVNMGYCRFENTFKDLDDCYEHMDDTVEDPESKARRKIIELSVIIALEYGEEVGHPVKE